MAIKAIINNIEKEIEQIKNSDEQDIDYVYSRIGDIEAEGNPPISMKSIGGNLADYRIYGQTVDGESVGDLVTSGEHAGEYCVPVTIEGKNLAKNNHADSSTLFTVEEVNNYIHVSGTNNSGSIKAYKISTENMFLAGSYDIVNNSDTAIGYDYRDENNALVYALVNANSIKTFNFPAVATRYLNVYKSVPNGESIDNYFQVMIVKHGDDTDTYEPYCEPITANLYLPEQICKVGDEAEYIDYGEQKLHRVGADDIDVTLPALSTVKGTNTLSVNTSIQPSNIYIKDSFDYKKVFTATRALEDELPLNYKNIEDNDSTLGNYRIYGNTVNGESVSDRTENLFANLWKKGYIRADNGLEEQIDGFICSGFLPVEYGHTYSISRNIRVGYDNIRGYRDDESFIGAGTGVCDVNNPFPNGTSKIGAFTVTNENVAFIRFNDSANDLGMKYMIVDGTYTEQTMPAYEPYGYRVPVTINGIITNIYLPEQIRKVGDEAEYIDYAEQKQYRIGADDIDVTLPALPTVAGTNTLSVGTQVQPSKVMVRGRIKEVN